MSARGQNGAFTLDPLILNERRAIIRLIYRRGNKPWLDIQPGTGSNTGLHRPKHLECFLLILRIAESILRKTCGD